MGFRFTKIPKFVGLVRKFEHPQFKEMFIFAWLDGSVGMDFFCWTKSMKIRENQLKCYISHENPCALLIPTTVLRRFFFSQAYPSDNEFSPNAWSGSGNNFPGKLWIAPFRKNSPVIFFWSSSHDWLSTCGPKNQRLDPPRKRGEWLCLSRRVLLDLQSPLVLRSRLIGWFLGNIPKNNYNTRWWFQIFLFSPRLVGRFEPIWLARIFFIHGLV